MLEPREIIENNGSILDEGLSDNALDAFFNQCFQDVIDDRQLHPAWACMGCMQVNYGEMPDECPSCGHEKLYQVATFQGRGTATGNIFQEAVAYILERFFPELGVISSRDTQYRDSCDLYVPNVAGIETKGSPVQLSFPNGAVVEFGRPGMRRTDTEKKANSNAITFKQDHPGGDVRFYVLSNALPIGWHEEHSEIDAIYNVTKKQDWEHLVYDLEVDKTRAARDRLDRR